MNQRHGEALKYLEHPAGHRRPLTKEHLIHGDISDKVEVIIDSRTRIYVPQGTNVEEARLKWLEAHKFCLTPTEALCNQ